jgi:hypothetical protein
MLDLYRNSPNGGFMKNSIFLSTSLAAIALSGWLSTAHADSAEAHCQVRKDGETKQGQTGPCTFSQRQGYIDLDLRNGETYSLSPGNQPDHFKDQKGNKVVRTQAGGNTQEFKWEGGKKVTVTFGATASSGGGGGGGIAVADMGRNCAGEASAKFHVSPRDITTQNAKQTQGMYEVWGQYPADPSPQVFICSYNAERKFLSVDKNP